MPVDEILKNQHIISVMSTCLYAGMYQLSNYKIDFRKHLV
jgi:hypothetical protein